MTRVAIITGAGRGIGAAAARAFAGVGYAVALAARSVAELDRVAAAIRADGGRALVVPTDVTDPTSVAALVDRAVAEFGGLHAALNNAGGGNRPAPLDEIDPLAFEESLRVNLIGTYLCMRAEIAAMRAQGRGAIVNMASTAGLQGVAGLAPYCAGKHGIVGLTKAAALDCAAAGIRVNAVAPGPIGTERIPESQWARIGSFVPLQRIGLPHEVAQLVLWLCSDASVFITGAVVPIDGGRLAGTPSFAIS